MTTINYSIDCADFPRVDMRKSFTQEPAALDFVLPGMTKGTVGALVSPGGLGKSWTALEMAMAVAGGPDLLDLGVKTTGPVLYLSAEDPMLAIEHRLYAARSQINDEGIDAVSANLEIVPLMGHIVDLMTPQWAKVIEQMSEGKRLVVIDTLRRIHLGDENSSSEMAQLLGAMEHICVNTGASILFLHHSGKGSAINGGSDQQQASRGSSVLADNVKGGQFNLSPMSEREAKKHGLKEGSEDRYVRLSNSKVNFGARLPDRWLVRGEGGILLPADMEGLQHAQRATERQQGGRERNRG